MNSCCTTVQRLLPVLGMAGLFLAAIATTQSEAYAQRQVTLTWNNQSTSDVNVFWVNPQGGEEAYGTVKAGESAQQPTFFGHRWVLRGPRGEVLSQVIAFQNRVVRIGQPVNRPNNGDGNGTGNNGGGRQRPATRARITWTNQSGADVEIFWVNFEGQETSYGGLRNGATSVQDTAVGHSWVIRNAVTKQVLQRFTATRPTHAVTIAGPTPPPMPEPKGDNGGGSTGGNTGNGTTSATTYWLGVPMPGDPTRLVFNVRVPDDVAQKVILRSDDKAPGASSFQRSINNVQYNFHQHELAWEVNTFARGGLSFSTPNGIGNTWEFASTEGAWPAFKRGLEQIATPYVPGQSNGWFLAQPMVVAVKSTNPPNLQISLTGPYQTASAKSEQTKATGENAQMIAVSADGGLVVGWREYARDKALSAKLTRFNPSGNGYVKAWEKQLPLPALGGVTTDGTNYYALCGKVEDLSQDGSVRTYRPGVLHLVKFDRSGNQVWNRDLNNPQYLGDTDANGEAPRGIYSPFVAGTGQVAYGNGLLLVALACNTLPDSNQIRHQRAQFFVVGEDGSGKKSYAETSGRHSFDQRVIFDGSDFIYMDLADSGWFMPAAGITVRKAKPKGDGTVDFTPPISEGVYIYARHGEANGGNFSFTSLGNMATGQRGYSVLFSSQQSNGPPPASGFSNPVPEARNLAFVHVVRDFDTVKDATVFTSEKPEGEPGLGNVHVDWRRGYFPSMINITANTVDSSGPTSGVFSRPDAADKQFRQHGVVWLTSYRTGVSVERPKLIKLADDRYVALWEEWSFTPNSQTLKYQSTKAMLVGEYGQVLRGATSIEARLNPSGADLPFLHQGKAAWVSGAIGGGSIQLHTVDQNLALQTVALPL